MTYVESLLHAVVDMVPQWFLANQGRFSYELTCGPSELTFFATRELAGLMAEFYSTARYELDQIKLDLPYAATPTEVEFFQSKLALWWLNRAGSPMVAWKKLMAYGEALRYRTYENSPVVLNLLIADEHGGTTDITDLGEIQKVMDPLASSLDVYQVVDKDIRYLDYLQVLHSQISDDGFNRCPTFLRPVTCRLGSQDFSFHRTQRGDIIIVDYNGILASWRKGRWYIYDTTALIFTLEDVFEIVGKTTTGSWMPNDLLDIAFDLSYKRHGALLIYDPYNKVISRVSNEGSKLIGSPNSSDGARQMLRNSVERIRIGGATVDDRQRKLLLEIASMDGAVIFNDEQVLAFGAMIKPHSLAKHSFGARSTAAYSARCWGGYPMKVSADGDISILFKSGSPKQRSRCDAQLTFG